MGKHLKVRVCSSDGTVLLRVRVTIPKQYRTRRDEWHRLPDAYADGFVDGVTERFDTGG